MLLTACRRASLRSASGKKAAGLRDLDPKYKRLLDEPVTMTLGLIGPDGRIGLNADVVRL